MPVPGMISGASQNAFHFSLSITDEVAVMIRRCLVVRYSTLVIATTSAGGVTVTVVTSGGELSPAVVVAAIWNGNVVGGAPAASATVKLTVAPGLGFGVSTTGVPAVCVHTKLHGSPRGSLHVAVIDTGVPDPTMRAGIWFTVGATAAPTVTVTVAVDVPTGLVTVSWNASAVVAVTVGATNVGAATAGSDSATVGPPVWVHAKPSGSAPVALPASVTVAPEATGWAGPD